jgi:hypothetical protein
MKIDDNGYLCRRTTKSGRVEKDMPHAFRNWWLVKHTNNGTQGRINVGYVMFTSDMVGKRVRFKLEVVEDD